MFKVTTRDVDGSGRNTYKTRKAAIAKFESMYGHSMQTAIEERYYDVPAEKWPTADTVRSMRAVSDYGTVVMFEEVQS